jgi:hypothetical protein
MNQIKTFLRDVAQFDAPARVLQSKLSALTATSYFQNSIQNLRDKIKAAYQTEPQLIPEALIHFSPANFASIKAALECGHKPRPLQSILDLIQMVQQK